MNEKAYVSVSSLEIPAETDVDSPWSGTRALMLAVLEDAVRNLGSSVGHKRAEAERWIMSPEHGYVFSFIVICETLNLAPSAVRRWIIRLFLDQNPRRHCVLPRTRPNVRHMERIQQHSARQSAA